MMAAPGTFEDFLKSSAPPPSGGTFADFLSESEKRSTRDTGVRGMEFLGGTPPGPPEAPKVVVERVSEYQSDRSQPVRVMGQRDFDVPDYGITVEGFQKTVPTGIAPFAHGTWPDKATPPEPYRGYDPTEDIKAGFQSGTTGITDVFTGPADVLYPARSASGKTRTELAHEAVQEALPVKEQNLIDPNFRQELFRSGMKIAGAVPPMVAKYAMGTALGGGSSIVGMGAVDLLAASAEPGATPWKALQSGVKGAILGKVLGYVSKYPKPAQVSLNAVIGGALTYADTQDVKEAIASALTMGMLSAAHGVKRENIGDFTATPAEWVEFAKRLDQILSERAKPADTGPPDAGPVRKGVAKSAEESAAILAGAFPAAIKSARESAGVFDRTLTTREAQLRAKAERLAVQVPETGIHESVARGIDARESYSRKLTGQRFQDLSPTDRRIVDELIAEDNAGRGSREAPPPSEPAPVPEAAKPAAAPIVPRAESQRPAIEPVAAERPVAAPPVPVAPKSSGPFGSERGSISPKPVSDKPNITSPNFEKSRPNVLKHMDVSPAEKSEMSRVIDSWEAENPGRKAVTFQEIRDQAKAIAPELVKYLTPPRYGETLNPAVQYAGKMRVAFLNEQRVTQSIEFEKTKHTLSPDEQMDHVRKQEAMENDIKGILSILFPSRSQDGRNLTYHRMMTNATWDESYWIGRARRAMGLPPGVDLPEPKRQAILQTIGEGRVAEKAAIEDLTAAGKPVTKENLSADTRVAKQRTKLAEQLTKLDRNGILETISLIRKAGLLTGIPTSVRNVGGNTAFQLLEESSRLPASLIDIAIAVGSHQRSVQGINLRAFADASYKASTVGVREGIEVMRHGNTDVEMAKFEAFRKVNTGSRVLDAYLDTVFNFQSAQDRVTKRFAMERSLHEQARLSELNGAGNEADLYAHPTPEMQMRAISDAEYATFNNKNPVAEGWNLTRGIMKAHGFGGEVGAFAMDMVVPFARTPSNIAFRVLDYTPLGVARGAVSVVRAMKAGKLTEAQQRTISMSIGRAAVGTAIIYLGAKLGINGVMTGIRPEDMAERASDEAVGRIPGAMLIDGKWRQVAPFSPLGNLLTLGASIAETATKPLKDELKRPWLYASIGGKTVLEQPYLKGINDVIEALKTRSPEGRAMSVASSMAGSFIPSAISGVAATHDTVRRQPQGISEGIKVRVPGLRQTVPEKVDVLGRTLPQEPLSVIDPTIGVQARELTDPLAKEIVRTQVNIGRTTKIPEHSESIKGHKVTIPGESREEHAAKARLVGILIERTASKVVQSERYQALESVDVRRLILQRTIAHARGELSKLTSDKRFQLLPSEKRQAIIETLLQRIAGQEGTP